MPRADPRRALRGRPVPSVAESQARHRALLGALPDGVLLQDADGTVLLANARAGVLLDLTPGDLPDDVLIPDGVVPSVIPAPRRMPSGPPARGRSGAGERPLDRLSLTAAALLRDGRAHGETTIAVPRADRIDLVRARTTALFGDDGQARAVVSTLTEIADAPEPEPPVDDLFHRAMRHSPIGVAITSLNGRFLRVNLALCRMLGYRADELRERTLFQLLHPAELEETSLRIGDLIHGDVSVVALERRYRGRGGMSLRGRLTVSLVRDDRRGPAGPQQFVVQLQDSSRLHRAQDLVTHMTLHDSLTGLANRTLALERIRTALDRERADGHQVAVLHCDVDRFQVINDSAGQESGDGVLVEIGRRIARALPAGDTAARLGGDEFAVVCAEVANEAEATRRAEHLQRAVGLPLVLAERTVGERTVHPRLSIGIAISAASEDDPVDLLRDAEIASRRAKALGRDRWNVADDGLRRRARERMDVEHSLRAGIAAGELELHFQPIVDVGSREVVGREALVRWNHPERGQLSPMLFLPVAEESGLIVEIGTWVMREAARTAAASPDTPGYVAVNVSPNQVARHGSGGLAEGVERALAETGLPAGRLVIELTESVMLSSSPEARREIEHLDGLGVRIVVDDFGTGFSALSYLRDLPVSGIKVDRSFTAGLGTDRQCERIVEALTHLAHGLGVDVVVEGVETESQREILASIGAEHAQGYLFGRPSPRFDLTSVATSVATVSSS
jgi:diguanylate cyclase (GGDEF)-like protein/PAS domain S-box-containing protein